MLSRALNERTGLSVKGALNEYVCAGGGSVVGADERPSKIASPAPSREGTEHGEDRCLFFFSLLFWGHEAFFVKIGVSFFFPIFFFWGTEHGEDRCLFIYSIQPLLRRY